ncbi:amidase [Dictyobacter alpinus]|uniref:Amidase n=2 Tax=Dictyobacter alpinus TaxID=2014873 RepID=A0A402BC01_9CHLR|nr:amidase [Dictyobacter alpinus]
MIMEPLLLAKLVAELRSGQRDLCAFVEEVCERIEVVEPSVQAFLPEPERAGRLLYEAARLQQRFPDPAQRPPLYGVLVGVKDIFRVDGFLTRAGSQLPPELFAGNEASCVSRLRKAGALILGKTVTTEFASDESGPTRNPHNLEHTPGGSSSGSAAAVAAGLCPLALGTQTAGSVIRPAAFCGIVGFKPTYGRIAADGVIPYSVSIDTIGLLTQDVAGSALAAAVLCSGWKTPVSATQRPRLGVPGGPYLRQASEEALLDFERQVRILERAGYSVKRVGAFSDIQAINSSHRQLTSAEMAQVHANWFPVHQARYRPRTAAKIRAGQQVSAEQITLARAGRSCLRLEMETLMQQKGIDLWISPAAAGPAPAGLVQTGDTAMNRPWSYAGMPALTISAGKAANGLPLGLQLVAPAMADEQLLAWAEPMAVLLKIATDHQA